MLLPQSAPVAAPARRLQQRATSSLRQRCSAARPLRACAVSASADGANVLAKLGRVLKEKAQADIDRIFKARRGLWALSALARGCECAGGAQCCVLHHA